MRITDARLTKVEDRGGKDSAGMAKCCTFDEVVQPSNPAAGDNGHGYSISNRPDQRQVIAMARAIAIHAGDEQLAGAKGRQAERVGNRI